MMQPTILEPLLEGNSSIIWLHGLGATKEDFLPIAELLQRSRFGATRFILPQAPIQPVTLNNGYAMPSWYDIIDLSHPRKISESELNASSDTIIELIEAEVAKGIPLERIILAGFSQGGAVALHTAFCRYEKSIGGVIALSTYAPTFDDSLTLSDEKRSIPSFHLHGSLDPVVLPQFGRAAYQFLKERSTPATWQSFEMQHEVIQEEIASIASWLERYLP